MGVFENGQSNVTLFAFDGDNCIYNSGNNVVINGNMGSGYPGGNNYIENFGTSLSMVLGAGADTVANAGSHSGLNLGDGQNSVGNTGAYVNITTGNGADTVVNLGNSVTIASGAGTDSVINQGSNFFINSGAQEDTVINDGDSGTINSSDGTDNIYNRGSSVTANLGTGDDLFVSYYVLQVDANMNVIATVYSAHNVTVNGDDGGDQLENYGGSATLHGGAGGDMIYNYGILVIDANGNFIGTSSTDQGYFLDGGDANDYIFNENAKATITGGAHNDTIINTANLSSLDGGTGADSIYSAGTSVTIAGGKGADTIILDEAAANNRIIYSAGDGNDLVQGFNSSTTLQIGDGSGTYSSQKSGDDVLVITGAGGDGRITLEGAASLASVNIAGLYFDPLLIIGADDPDVGDQIFHWGQGVSIDAGAGDDTIYVNGNNFSVSGGKGKDSIYGEGKFATIDGGDDDDEILLKGSNGIITGGKGKDLISLNAAGVNNLIKYKSQDDNDIIYGFNETDSLQIITGKIDSVFSNGFDDFVIVDGQAIKLVSASWIRNMNVVDADGNAINLGEIAIDGTDENDSIVSSASGRIINPGAGNDYIFNLGSYMTITGGTGNKTIELDGTNNEVNLGRGIHIVSLSGGGTTVNSSDNSDDAGTTVLNGQVVYIDKSGFDEEKLEAETLPQISDEDLTKLHDTLKKDEAYNDILQKGKDSKYFEGLENEEAEALVGMIQKIEYMSDIPNQLKQNGTEQNYRDYLRMAHDVILDHYSTLAWLLERKTKINVPTAVGFGVSVYSFFYSIYSVFKTWNDFYKKNPDAYKKAWEEVGGFSAKDLLHLGELRDKWADVQYLARAQDPDSFDRAVLSNYDFVFSTASLSISTLEMMAEIRTKGKVKIPTWVDALIENSLLAARAKVKTDYLMNVRTDLGTYRDVYNSQLWGYGLGGTFENLDIKYRDVPSNVLKATVSAYNFIPYNEAVMPYAAAEETSGSVAMLLGSAGNDSFTNEFELTSINAGAGNDTIMNSAARVTILTGADDDLVRSTGSQVLISGTDGDNSINNSGALVTITTGAGNDVVKNSESERVTITTGDGDDYIENLSSLTSAAAGAGADYILSFGEGNTLDAGTGSDTVHNFGNNTTVLTGDGNDVVENLGDNVILTASSGDNEIHNGGYFVKIETGAGKDVIENLEGKNNTITSGAGNDYIENLGDSNSIAAGAGDDYLFVSGKANTVNAGTGDDIIDLAGASETEIQHASGDGNDTIYGFNEDDTLKIDDTYSLMIGDKDIVVTRGEEKITLAGAAKLSTLNIAGEEIFLYDQMFSGLADGATDSDFTINGKVITVSKAAVKTDGTPVKILTDGYTLKLGKGMTAPKTTKASYANGTLTTAGKTAGYTLSEDSITYTAPTTKEIKFSGVADDATVDNFYLKGKTLTIGKAAVQTDGTPIKILTDGYTLKLGKGMNPPTTTKASYANGTLTTAGKSAGYTLSEDSITYSAPTTKEIKFSGVDSEATVDNFYLKGKTLTVGKDAVQTDGTPVKLLTDGYTLKLGKGMTVPTTTKASYSNGTLTTAGKSAGYTLSEDSITYTAPTTKEIKFSGVADAATAANFYVKGKTITIGKDAVQTDGTPVKILTDGYTLKLGKGMNPPTTTKASYANGTLTTAGKSAGYTLSEDSITYSAPTTKEIKFSGVDSDATVDNFYLKGKTLTIGKAAVQTDGTPVKILTDGYTLKLGKGMTAPKTTKATYANNVYKTAGKSAGYTLSEDSITYTAPTTKEIKFSGVDSEATVDNFYLKGKTLTIGKDAVQTDGTPVKILTDGYTLKLGKGMTPSKKDEAWSLSETTATLKQTTTAGYSLVDNAITYTGKSSAALAAVTGVKNLDGLSVDGKTIKLSGDALNDKVTVSGAYTFDFADDYEDATITGSSSDDTIVARGENIFVTGGAGADVFAFTASGTVSDYDEADKISLTGAAEISVSGSDVIFGGKITVAGAAALNVTYIEGGVEKIYSNTESAVEFNAAGTAATLTVNYEEESFVANSKLVTINASAVQQSLMIFGNDESNNIIGTGEDDLIYGGAGADTLAGSSGKDTLSGGSGDDSLFGGSGNDSLWGNTGDDTLTGGKGNDVFVYQADEGTDTITDFAAGDMLQIMDGTFSDSALSGSTLTLDISGGGSVVFQNVSESQTFNINGATYSISNGKLK